MAFPAATAADVRGGAPVTLAELTTFRVGGPAREYVVATTEAELIDVVRAADAAAQPVLVIGGGSNLVVSDAGFDGVVVKDGRTGFEVASRDACGGANFRAVAGQGWDELVAESIAREWVGLEALSGIPGTVGAAPVQNIGAYGQEVAGSIASVRVWDRAAARVRTMYAAQLGFGYRTSVLKRTLRTARPGGAPWAPTPAFVVLDVEFQLRLGTRSAPIGYGELARTLGVAVGERAESAEVRRAVLELRGGKGMLLDDPAHPDHDRWSAGSFFTNPVVPAALADQLPADAPRYPVYSPVPQFTTGPSLGAIDDSQVKTSAAWLIDHAGFTRGYGVHGEASRARLSTRHTLALTNRGDASAADIVELARVVRGGVRDRFGITLEPEPVLVGVDLD